MLEPALQTFNRLPYPGIESNTTITLSHTNVLVHHRGPSGLALLPQFAYRD